MAQNEEDRHCIVRFYHGAVRNSGKSETAGRPVFDDVEMCEIKFPGDNGRSWVGPALLGVFMHRPGPGEEPLGHISPAQRFPDHYKRWKENDPSAARNGTPLEHLPFLTPGKVYELKAQNIHTAEALVGLSSGIVTKLGATTIVAQAKVWLGEAETAATVAAAEAEKSALQSQFDALKAEIAALKAAKPKATGDEFDAMTDDALRTFLADRGAAPRANAARDKMLAAVRDIAAQEAEVAAMRAEIDA
jgi:cell division protein FtsB